MDCPRCKEPIEDCQCPELTPEEMAVIYHMAKEEVDHPVADLLCVLLELRDAIGMDPLPPVSENPWERDALLESARRKAGLVDEEPWRGP